MSIYNKQNEDGMLLLNKTKKCLYTRAKTISTIRTAVITIITCVFVILTSIIDSQALNALSIVFGVMSFIVSLIVDKFVRDLKWLAAGAQQEFDCYIFGIDNNIPLYAHLGLDFPDRAQIAKYENRYINKEVKYIENWYSDYSNLSKANQILNCQKENFRWESTLKRIYLGTYIVYYLLLLLAIVLVGIFTNDIFKMFSIYTWVLPIGKQAVVSVKGLASDLKRLQKIDKQIKFSESTKTDETMLLEQVRYLQALIYEHRVKSLMVPDLIYKILRKKLQNDEQAISRYINLHDNNRY